MMNEQEVLKIVVSRLEGAGFQYMVTGSIAANFYTTPRMTRDIDMVIEFERRNPETFFTLFSNDFYIDLEAVKNAVMEGGIFNIIHREGVVKVDLIVRKKEEYRMVEFERRKRLQMEGFSLYVVSPEDLILSKLYWAKDSLSEMQIKDVKNLMKTNTKLDWPYLQLWVERLKLQNIYKRAKE